MMERLVVEKSERQWSIEAIVMLTLTPAVPLGLWWFWRILFAPSLLAVVIFYGTSAVGNVYATYFGKGARVTLQERYRRMMERALARGFWRATLWFTLAYFVLMIGILVPMTPPEQIGQSAEWIVPLALVTSLATAIYLASYIRLRIRALAQPDAESMPILSPWQFLRRYIPGYYFGVGAGLAGGYAVSLLLGAPWSAIAIGAGFVAGAFIHSVLQERLRATRPVLWAQFGFLAALCTAVLQLGIPFGIMVYLIDLRMYPGEALGHFSSAAAGLLFGMILGLFLWLIGKLGALGFTSPRDPAR